MKYIGPVALGVTVLFLASCSTQTSEIPTENTSIGEIETMDTQKQNTDKDLLPEEASMLDEIVETMIEDTETETLTDDTQSTFDTSILSTEQNYSFSTDSGVPVVVWPISHATMVIEWGEDILYIDPAEELSAYEGYPVPNYVFVTHEHGDHYNEQVLTNLVTQEVTLVVNPAVSDMLPEALSGKAIVMANGDSQTVGPMSVDAIPAYNIREEALNYHPEGRDNGYILETDGFRMYISGDTEDTPELRALTDIDVAFVSMNLPYTMPVENAADGVLAFAPETIIPYHFRGMDGMGDVGVFRDIVSSKNPDINVILHNWYQD